VVNGLEHNELVVVSGHCTASGRAQAGRSSVVVGHTTHPSTQKTLFTPPWRVSPRQRHRTQRRTRGVALVHNFLALQAADVSGMDARALRTNLVFNKVAQLGSARQHGRRDLAHHPLLVLLAVRLVVKLGQAHCAEITTTSVRAARARARHLAGRTPRTFALPGHEHYELDGHSTEYALAVVSAPLLLAAKCTEKAQTGPDVRGKGRQRWPGFPAAPKSHNRARVRASETSAGGRAGGRSTVGADAAAKLAQQIVPGHCVVDSGAHWLAKFCV